MTFDLDSAFSRLDELAGTATEPCEEIARIVESVARAAMLPGGILSSGAIVHRARVNPAGVSFTHQRELSYNPNSAAITRYGRANAPGQSVFYCSEEAATALFETVDAVFPDRNTSETGSMSIGSWRAIRPVEITLILNSETALTRFPAGEAGDALRFLLAHADPRTINMCRRALDYFVARFAASVTNHLQYRITSAFFNFVVADGRSAGIVYPSVRRNLMGVNMALLPEVVDQRLELVDVARVDFTKEGDRVDLSAKVSDYFDRKGGFVFYS
jgi:hypothetical protein